MKTIELTDIGPVESLRIPVPEAGGVVVLHGRNGSGKTTALTAVDALVGGRNGIAPRDGCQRGEVDGFGATLRVGRKMSRSGELEVLSLEGKLSPADLVDPGLKSDEAADAVRIKSLLQLVGAKPDVKLFWEMVGGQAAFEAAVPDDLANVGDAVALASKVKRGFESAARREEATAENELGKAAAYKKAGDGLDMNIETDVAVLQSRLESAVSEQTRLTTQAATAEQASKQLAVAKQALAANGGVAFQDFAAEIKRLEQELSEAASALKTAGKEWTDAQFAERAAKSRYEGAAAKEDALSRMLAEAKQRAEDQRAAIEAQDATQKTCRDLIAAAESVVMPTADEIDAAAAEVDRTREAIEAAAVVRKAQEQIVKAVEHEQRAKDCQKRANKLRDAATATDQVLSELVSKCGTPLEVRGGRLWLQTRRGLTLFAELSHGERWCVAIDVALQAFPKESEQLPVLTIPQEAWESLDPVNRKLVAEHAVLRGVLVLTAACSDGPLGAEAFAAA